MPQKKHKPEEIVAKLRQVDVLVSQGQSVAEAVRSIRQLSARIGHSSKVRVNGDLDFRHGRAGVACGVPARVR